MLNSEIYIEEKLSKIARIYNLLEKFEQKVEIFQENVDNYERGAISSSEFGIFDEMISIIEDEITTIQLLQENLTENAGDKPIQYADEIAAKLEKRIEQQHLIVIHEIFTCHLGKFIGAKSLLDSFENPNKNEYSIYEDSNYDSNMRKIEEKLGRGKHTFDIQESSNSIIIFDKTLLSSCS